MEIKRKLAIDGKNILIIGNWAYRNLWDELILLWTVKLLMKENKNIFISCFDPIWLNNFFSQFIDTTHITFLHEVPHWIRSFFKYFFSWKFFELRHYLKINSVILWGGEIITEENPKSYSYWLISLLPYFFTRKCKNYSLYIMWGIQIPEKKSNKRLLNFLLKRTKKIYARDFSCVDEIKKYWFKNSEFFMDTSYFSLNWNNLQKPEKKEKLIVINLNKNGEHFLSDMRERVKKYDELWYKIYYIPIAKWHNSYYQDIQYLPKIIEETGIYIEALDREDDFHKFITTLNNVEISLSTRLHIFLIARFLWIKTEVFPYQRKIQKMKITLDSLDI